MKHPTRTELASLVIETGDEDAFRVERRLRLGRVTTDALAGQLDAAVTALNTGDGTHECDGPCNELHIGSAYACELCEECPSCRLVHSELAADQEAYEDELRTREQFGNELDEARDEAALAQIELDYIDAYLTTGYSAGADDGELVSKIRAARRRDRIRTALITGAIGLAAVALALML